MKPVQLTIDELVKVLADLRLVHGNVPVEVYDLTNWETLPFLAVEYSEAPGSVLILAADREGGEGR